MQGIKIKFNKFNSFKGCEKCCCQKGYKTKFFASTLFCTICNIICARRLMHVSSFCKKYGWEHNCETCNQKGDYHF